MSDIAKNLGYRSFFLVLALLIISIDIVILLNIPFLRQIMGFLFLTILPGVLILQILNLNKLELTEKFVLSVGLSISFLMFFGLLINNILYNLGYLIPLSTISLLISFNIAFIVLAIIGYKLNKDLIFSQPNLELSISEKAFLIVPILFPALSILGMHVMNTTDNNIIVMFLLFLIPVYVAFVCFFNQKFSKRKYPVVIFSISISLVLLLSLRSDHLLGSTDTHLEYYFFQITLDSLHWRTLRIGGPLDACLTISLLPTIYQSILNVSSEFLFKILYSLICSITPLVIYVLSKKYIGAQYGFLAACFFMFQLNFLGTANSTRMSIALLFFALAMMTLFSDKIEPLRKRMLFIIFMASCMVSHYSTTYIFFFIIVGAFVGIEILPKKYTVKKVISLTIVLLFFALIFIWYSQVTETAFNCGVSFVESTLSELNRFFIEESRQTDIQSMMGKDIQQKGVPHKIEFIFTWLTFALIGIGLVTLIRRYKEMSFSELKFKKPDFLKEKFEVTYFLIALACAGLLVVMVALPHISIGYGIDRLYAVAIVILSVFFVIGGITLSKLFFFFTKRKPVLKEKQKSLIKNFSFNKKLLLKKQKEGKNALRNPIRKGDDKKKSSEVLAYLIILLVLIPYFLCVTGVMYNIFGVPRAIILNSEGESHKARYLYDSDSRAAKWLGWNAEKNIRFYSTGMGGNYLMSQGKIPLHRTDTHSLLKYKVKGYIYLLHDNLVEGRVSVGSQCYNLTEYSDRFIGTNKIYANGGSEVYKT